MDIEISAESAVEIISRSFAPLRCRAEAFDYKKFVRFRVFDINDNPIFRAQKLTPMDYKTTQSLQTTIEDIRSALIEKGYKLDPWEMEWE